MTNLNVENKAPSVAQDRVENSKDGIYPDNNWAMLSQY